MNMEVDSRALSFLKRFFGYDKFRSVQLDVIRHVLGGHDAVVLMPTGGGKSICYQIPAMMSDGCAIVVSPLLSLMKDQVDALLANGIPAAALNSMQTEAENREIMEHAKEGHIKLLYVSPEKLLSDLPHWSSDFKISLIAIDEAHCISHWGHDFRPEYTQLSVLKDRFPGVPILALTATADRVTRDDIKKQLRIDDAKLFISSFDRPNLSLWVVKGLTGRAKINFIARFIERHGDGSGIIYCLSRKSTESLSLKLNSLGINCRPFHAGLSADVRNATQQDFVDDNIKVVCATVAFGMGIDKGNVRWVIHYNMPGSIENYYQEIGRAGRDGLPADALLFYSYSDVVALTKFAQESGQKSVNLMKLQRMQEYAEATVCRRRILLSYFNERYDCDCGRCDVCLNPPAKIDGSVLAQMAMSAIIRTGEKVGFNTTVDILKGSLRPGVVEKGYNRLPTFGVGRNLTFREWGAYLLQMLQLGIVEIKYDDNNNLRVTEFGKEILTGRRKVEFSKYELRDRSAAIAKQEEANVGGGGEYAADLFKALKQLRLKVAREKGIKPYLVFNDSVLQSIASLKPKTRIQFGMIHGIAERKTELYWKQFTDFIKSWELDNG